MDKERTDGAVKKVTFKMEDFLYDFYRKVGEKSERTAEQVMNDTLFRFARDASLRTAGKGGEQGDP